MDWERLAAVDVFQLERNESLLDSLYTFLEKNELSAAEAARAEPDQLAKTLSVVQRIMKVKGEEAKVAMEELLAQQQAGHSLEGGVPNERALMNQIVQLEREMREKDRVIEGLKERGNSPTPGAVNEARVLRQENEDLRLELGETKRRLDNERGEADRLSGEAVAERVKTRQLEREVDQLRNDVEEYRCMKSQGEGVGGGGGASLLRAGEREYRERLRNKDLEIAEQLDKIEELLNVRDDLERQRQELTEKLGRVEEQRIACLRETEETRQALVEADGHCSELQTKNSLLEGQVSDLQECLREKTQAEQQTHTAISERNRQWESTLSSKDSELADCREQIQRLQSQLAEAGKDSNRATVIRLKKQLQERDQELSELQEEMAQGATALEELSSQLEEERLKTNPTVINTALQKALESAKMEAEGLRQALGQEMERRQTSEASAVQREEELTQALSRLGEYERGEYGLREAVQEIKMKKEEIAVRDRDIAELTQQVNSLDRQVNELGEFNEMLCERLGVGTGENVGFAEWRAKKEGERERLREENRSLQKEVERLKEEKLVLRKRLVGLKLTTEPGERSEEVRGGMGGEGEGGGGRGERGESDEARDDLRPLVAQLRAQVVVLQRECVQERREKARLQTQIQEQMTSRPDSRDGEREREKRRGDKMAEELKSTYRMLERKTIETERLEKEADFLRQAASGFQPIPLPECIPMTSRDVIASLNEHLLHALKAEKGRSQECEAMKTSLEKYQCKFSVIIHQQGILYKEYSDSKKEWEREREQLRQRVREMEAVTEAQEIRHQELKSLQALLSSDPDQQKQRQAELSRQVTTLRVNERTLSRRYTLLYEREAALRRENDRLRNDLITLERSVTERIGYLERHKEAMLFKLSTLQHQLSESVAATELDKTSRQFTDLAVKYQAVLQKMAAQNVAEQQVERLQVEVKTLREQLTGVREELTGVREELAREKVRTGSLQEHHPSPQTETEGVQPQVATSNRLVTMEMKELNERQRADLVTARNTRLHDDVMRLEKRNVELEGKLAAVTESLLQSQNRETELMERMADYLSPEEMASLESKVTDLRKSEARLKLEATHLKEVSDVARQQVVAMETWKKSHDLVMSSLHHQLLDAQSASDDKTVVGKLQLQIASLQVSESEALRALETANVKILQLEAGLLRSEQERDKVLESAFHARSQSQTKITQLRTIIQVLRRRCAGAIPLSDQEKQVELVLGLREQHREVERLREETTTAHDLAQEKLAELEMQQTNLHELLSSLKDPNNVSGRLMEWHAKLGEARLREMKAVRSREKADSRVHHLEGVICESERKMSKMEEDLVQVTKEYESSQLSWEQRELDLEQQLRYGLRSEGERQREKDEEVAAKSTDEHDTMQQVHDAAAEMKLALETQLSQAIADLQQKSQTISELRQDLMHTEHQANTLEQALKTSQNHLLRREKELSELKVAKIQSEGLSREEREGQRMELIEAQRGKRLAEERVQQLQVLVSQKEGQCEKYQRLLQDARSELHSMTESHKFEVASLVKKLHAQSDSAVLKLKEVSMDAVAMPVVTGATEKQLARLHELEDLIGQQRVSYEAQLEEVRQESKLAKQEYEVSFTRMTKDMEELKRNSLMEKQKLQNELSHQSTRVMDLEQELEVMSGELSAAQETIRQAPSHTTKALVEKLRQQLAVKEKQQKALNEALIQVRAELLDATQKTLLNHTHQEITEVNLQRMVHKRTAELEERVEELSSNLNGMQTEVERSRDREAAATQAAELASDKMEQLRSEQERRKREEEGLRREREEGRERVRRLEGDLQQCQKTVEQGRVREQRLARELQVLQQRADHKPEVEDLQRKLKVLQTRFDRQKQQIDTLRQQQKVVHVAVGANQPAASPEDSAPLISIRHSSQPVLKWEENKKWQRKVAALRDKLAEKTREAESTQHHVTSLKGMLERGDHEKSLLQGKIKSLQKTISDLERSGNLQVSEGGGSHGGGGIGYQGDRGGDHGDRSGSHTGSHTPTVEELQRVISAMRNVVEKLQRENERLRREGKGGRERGRGEGRKEGEVKREGKEREGGGEREGESGRVERREKQLVPSSSSPKSALSKIASENDRLRKSLKREMEQNERLSISLKTSEVQTSRLQEELHKAQHESVPPSLGLLAEATRSQEEVVERLRAEVEKKSQMVSEVKSHLREAAEREGERERGHRLVVEERDALREQVQMLRKELDAFDPSFFEEVEDLKFNYQEAVKKNVQYEQHITQLSQQLGVSPPTFIT